MYEHLSLVAGLATTYQPDAEPPIGGVEPQEGGGVVVDVTSHHLEGSLLVVQCPQCGQTSQGLREVGKNGGPGDAVQALQLPEGGINCLSSYAK